MTEVLQPAFVDQPHVVIAALGCNVRPLREVELAERVEVVDVEPDPLRIKERLLRIDRERTSGGGRCRGFNERLGNSRDVTPDSHIGPDIDVRVFAFDLIDPSLIDPETGRDLQFAAFQDVIDADRYMPDAWPDLGRRVPDPGRTQPAAEWRQHQHGRLDLRRHESLVRVRGVAIERGGQHDDLVPVGDVHRRDRRQPRQA